MESDRTPASSPARPAPATAPPADPSPAEPSTAELRERERVIRRSAASPHLDGSGLSWWLVIGGSVLNTALAGLIYLIVREEVLWLVWLALLPPIGGPMLWSAGSRLIRRRNGVAPARLNQPVALRRLSVRLALVSIPLELGIILLVAFTPAWVVLPVTFGASVLVFWFICAVYARKARALGAPAA
jgi:hypothetical protein